MNLKISLVTGSSKGIGAAIARRFAADQFHSVVTFHPDKPGAQLVVDEILDSGGSASLHHLDVRSEDSVVTLMQEIDNTYGRLDTLVANAVTEIAKPIDVATLEEWHTVLLTKLDGAFLSTKYAVPLLCNSDNPSIIYITSIDGDKPNGDYIGYQVGAAGLIAMTKANAVYLAKTYGIRVNAVSPGPVKTHLWDHLGGENQEMWDRFATESPMGRIASTGDVAEACLYLANDPQKFLNGVFLSVDGGSQWS